MPMKIPAKQEDAEFAAQWIDLIERLLAEGKIKGGPRSVREGCLGGVLEGLDDLRKGRISEEKLGYDL